MFEQVFFALCLWSLARYAGNATISAWLFRRATNAQLTPQLTPRPIDTVPELLAGEAYTPAELSEIVHEYDRRIDELETIACTIAGHAASETRAGARPECRRCGEFM